MAGIVEDIFIAPTGGAPMRRVQLVQAEAGAGLTGDRYRDRTGYWTTVEEWPVPLIAAAQHHHPRRRPTQPARQAFCRRSSRL